MPGFDSSLYGDEVDKLVRAEVQTWDVGGVSPSHLEECIVTGADLGKIVYRHTSVETQVQIALWTAVLVAIDNFDVDAAATAEFAERFHIGQAQLHPLLDRLAGTLRRMHEFFHPHSAAIIVSDSVQCVSCMVVDKENEERGSHPASIEYLTYKRLHNGLGDGYAYCVWDKLHFPDLSAFIQAIPETSLCFVYLNDLLSFYKEEVVGERANFVHERARVTGKDVQAALMDTLNDTVDAVNRGRRILQDGPERSAWEGFLEGYVVFHFMSPRYKLKQLFESSD
ncbi:terpenoid synthase-like protein [Phanerochaete sordida]|uniref:Terpenoid synthase-like protein n=1 Tax=Phanerochaete sordida TaxID=48140 RepID=A0A9P3GN59_9APHY|nr:terpenoid synthase-like protein [Phanerochaete sordida]